jgi:hypothetical protein
VDFITPSDLSGCEEKGKATVELGVYFKKSKPVLLKADIEVE